MLASSLHIKSHGTLKAHWNSFSTDTKMEVIHCPSGPSRFDHFEAPSWPNNKLPEELFSLTRVIFGKGLGGGKIVNGWTWWSSRASSDLTILWFYYNTCYTRHILSIHLNWGSIKIKDKLCGKQWRTKQKYSHLVPAGWKAGQPTANSHWMFIICPEF